MKLLRDQGMDTNRRYFFLEIGFNFRLTNLQCAILVAQIERLDDILDKRRKIFARYDDLLRNNKNILYQEIKKDDTASQWLYTFKFAKLEDNISVVRKLLFSRGIDTRPVFIPMSKLPPYRASARGDFKISENISDLGLSIPTFNSITPDQIAYISKEINQIAK